MKKIIALAIVLVFALAIFTACSNSAPAASSAVASASASAAVSASASPSAAASASASVEASPSASASAATDGSLQKIKDKGKFVLGFDDTFKPMGFKDESGKYVGFDIDMATAFCKKLGVELVLQPIEWKTKDMELSSGKIDAIWNGFSITDEQKATVSYSVPYMANKQALVVRADSKIQTLKDLAGKKVITQDDSSAYYAITKNKDLNKSLKQLIKISDYVKAFIELKSGTVDCVAIDEIYARYQITTDKDNFRILDENLGTEQYGVGFRKNDIALTNEFNKIYAELKADGTAKQISEKWFGSDICL